jgi:hypothetical protein
LLALVNRNSMAGVYRAFGAGNINGFAH